MTSPVSPPSAGNHECIIPGMLFILNNLASPAYFVNGSSQVIHKQQTSPLPFWVLKGLYMLLPSSLASYSNHNIAASLTLIACTYLKVKATQRCFLSTWENMQEVIEKLSCQQHCCCTLSLKPHLIVRFPLFENVKYNTLFICHEGGACRFFFPQSVQPKLNIISVPKTLNMTHACLRERRRRRRRRRKVLVLDASLTGRFPMQRLIGRVAPYGSDRPTLRYAVCAYWF